MLDMKIGMQLQQELVSKNGTSSVLLRSINFILAALTGRGRFFFFFLPLPSFFSRNNGLSTEADRH